MAHRFLRIGTVHRWEPVAADLGVSDVARSSRGFLGAYEAAGGRLERLPAAWVRKREAFIKRHVAQAKKRHEPWWEDGLPTRRHLALIMWAYSPTPGRL